MELSGALEEESRARKRTVDLERLAPLRPEPRSLQANLLIAHQHHLQQNHHSSGTPYPQPLQQPMLPQVSPLARRALLRAAAKPSSTVVAWQRTQVASKSTLATSSLALPSKVSTLRASAIPSPARLFHSSQLNYEAVTQKVPSMAESISEGTLKQWTKKKGDFVEADEEVATIETDKVSGQYSMLASVRSGTRTSRRGDPCQVWRCSKGACY